MEARRKLTLDEVMETPEYRALTPKQQLFVATYVEGGLATGTYDRLDATRKAYVCKDEESVRVMSYAMMGNIRVIEALNRHFNTEPIEEFLQEVSRAIHNRRLSTAQVQALKIKADLLGYAARLPGASGNFPIDPTPANQKPVRKPRKVVDRKAVPAKKANHDYEF